MLDELYTAMVLYLTVGTLPLECVSSAQRYNYKKSAKNYNYNGSHLHYRKKVGTKTVSKPTDAAASVPSHQWTEGIHYKSVKEPEYLSLKVIHDSQISAKISKAHASTNCGGRDLIRSYFKN